MYGSLRDNQISKVGNNLKHVEQIPEDIEEHADIAEDGLDDQGNKQASK